MNHAALDALREIIRHTDGETASKLLEWKRLYALQANAQSAIDDCTVTMYRGSKTDILEHSGEYTIRKLGQEVAKLASIEYEIKEGTNQFNRMHIFRASLLVLKAK